MFQGLVDGFSLGLLVFSEVEIEERFFFIFGKFFYGHQDETKLHQIIFKVY